MRRAPFACVLLAAAAAAAAQTAPRHFVFTWQGDTATTLCVNFQSTGEEPLPAVVHWDTVPRDGAVADYRYRAEGTRFQIEGLRDRWVYRVPLTGLAPGGTVHLVAGHRLLGMSREYKVRTIADDGRRLRFATGGDMGPSADTRALLRQAARQDPDFVLIGGDIAYANGQIANVGRWDTWLTYWSEEMVASDGRSIPVALAIGNHEVRGGYGQPASHAPFFFGFFAQDERSYSVRRFGPHLAVWLLDSGHVEAHGPEQAAWLDRTMEAMAEVPHKVAVYHVPLYPSHRVYETQGSVAGRLHWAPVFDRRGLDIAFENHDHTWKRTVPLRGGLPDPRGVLYLGDGCFGQVPRAVCYRGRWYLEHQASMQHFWCVDVDAEGLTCRAIDRHGETFDVWPETAPGAEAAAAARARAAVKLRFPSGTSAVDDLRDVGDRWQEGDTRLTFRNTFGVPCELRVSLDAPAGASLAVEPAHFAAGGHSPRLEVDAVAVVSLRLRLPEAVPRADVRLRVRVTCTVHELAGPLEIAEIHTVVPAAR